jgi:hypothetical protein
MADKQEAPQAPAGLQPLPALGGSVTEAQEALLSLMEPEEATPETEEAQPTEVEESQPEEEGESLEEGSEEEEESVEEEEESEEADEEVEEELVYAVTVNGEEQEVTLDELMKGYSRQSDYTKKTQGISEQRKEFEELSKQYTDEISQIQNERGQYVQALEHAIKTSLSGAEQFAQIDWDRLRSEDPVEFALKKDEYRDMQDKVRQNQQEQANIQQKQQEDYRKNLKEHLKKENGLLLEKMPEWGDSKKQKGIAEGIRTFAKSIGFSDEEIGGLSDHRSLITIHKAKLYDDLQKADVKSKKVKNKPRVVRAGSGVAKDADKRSKRASQMKRLRGTGHLDDASALLEDFIDI